MARIRIYTDNGADLEQEVLKQYKVNMFHMQVTINDVTYRNNLQITPKEFYRLIAEPGVIPITAQITPLDFKTEFERVLRESDDEVIYIAFSSALSGTYQAACMARDQLASNRITVVDSKAASVGCGLIVIRGAEAVLAGKEKEQVLADIKDHITRLEQVFIVGNFEMLRRGGRVSSASAALGNMLNIKLILHLQDGYILPLEKAHGFKKARRRLLDTLEERGHNLQDQLIGISHADHDQGARELKELIMKRFGCNRFLVSEIGAVIGSHVGAGTLSVFFLGATNS